MKEKKKENKLKTQIKKMKETSRGKAILKLIYWGIFFLFIFIFCIISSVIVGSQNNLNTDTKKPTESVKEPVVEKADASYVKSLLTELESSNYDFEYKITMGDNIYKYNGKKENNFIEGYKETSEKTIKYFIDETGIYEETTNSKVLIDNLYEGLNSEYFDIQKLNNILNTKDLKEYPSNCIDSCPMFFNSENIKVELLTEKKESNNKISSISIEDEGISYYFKFKNVRGK